MEGFELYSLINQLVTDGRISLNFEGKFDESPLSAKNAEKATRKALVANQFYEITETINRFGTSIVISQR